MTPTIDRRLFLGGLLGGAAALGLSACGAPSLRLPEQAATGVASAGATMRIARPAANAAETLDPASSLSAYEYLGAVYNRLVKLDREGATVPDLATEWSSSADAMTWDFALQQGVRFHDGRALTARDVRYTYGHILDPDTASPQAGALDQIDEIEAVDATTVRFRLTSPNAEFPSLLTAYQCYIIPEDSAADIGRTGIGTGPFALESFTPAGAGVVRANEDYFGGRATLDRIEFYSIQDTSARVNALLARQVDLLSQTNLDNPTARVVASSPGTTVARVENAQWYTIPMLATSEEFSDPVMRQAMKLAYDPRAILSTALQGTGTPGWDNPVPPQLKAWMSEEREHDPEQAKALLKSIGQEDFSTRIYTSAYEPNFTAIATAFASQVSQAGIDLQITNTSADSYYTQIWMAEPLMVSYWFTGRPIDQLLNQIFRTGSSYNESAWSNEQFDQLLDSARADTNDASRLQKYQDAQRLIVEDSADLTPVFGDRLVGLSQDVVNYDEYGFEFDYLALGLREG
ncbi:ABC transporter substrate-binding protein [Ornithinimicrobium faecis]|uniref:ABC transporter substrate-binding protein n=1 Tax=Ornithinimicrobium faecis TaxID=2934158 RepID=A0ABY4YY48_9MICO|nr:MULTISPECIES: ABC transporter substrate-binding protein [unclassified Ornithinimicrobium]USQ81703.1 ABC transporter substrate-binding protein [Ornithinimicrobium sp. HY1793]